MYRLRDFSTDVLVKLGNISIRQLSEPVLLSKLYSTINMRLVELNISTQNWLLKSTEVTFDGTDTYSIDEEDFGTPVMVQISNANGSKFVPIEIVNIININIVRDEERVAAGFYKDDTGENLVQFTFPSGSGYSRIYYEPDSPMPHKLDANVPLQKLFKDYITAETAMICLPFVKIDPATKRDIRDALLYEITKWEQLWLTQINRAKTGSSVVRGGFRAGQ